MFVADKYKILLKIRWQILKKNDKKVEQYIGAYLSIEKEKLVYLRGVLDFIYSEEKYRNYCMAVRGQNEMQEWIECMNSEDVSRSRFELRNIENKRLVAEREKNNPKITDLDAASLSRIQKLFNGYI